MKNYINTALLLLIIVLVGVMAVLFNNQNQALKDKNSSLESSINTTKDSLDKLQSFVSGLPPANLKRLVYEPSSNMLYLPDLKIKVPYNADSASLMYSTREDETDNNNLMVDINTDKLPSADIVTQLDCRNILRLKIEPKPNPFNPAEIPTSFKLNDGRTLQVYAFSGELEGNNECKMQYENLGIFPKDFVKVFKGVESY